ncbi:hypothetical protein PgNI_10807 [Pyricularia grisea]|uniref:Uncharacterized protein n=1 Tax=Pyricularia grisea TaxID=148305 RepID=A0A6P8AX34_PYRGI|nr:hypothetical protein PgNI_10807 [Pyricularia grisea]TLD06887.1 hypothetical protein PgNI_10807 [Pyricularia grisea]
MKTTWILQVAAPSTSRSTPALRADTLLLRPGSETTDNWSEKAKRRKTTGTGRMRYLSTVTRKFKNDFQTGTPKGSRGINNVTA